MDKDDCFVIYVCNTEYVYNTELACFCTIIRNLQLFATFFVRSIAWNMSEKNWSKNDLGSLYFNGLNRIWLQYHLFER